MEGDNEDFNDLNEKELDQEFKLSGQLSDNFKEFIRRNNIPEDAYNIKTLSRFIRYEIRSRIFFIIYSPSLPSYSTLNIVIYSYFN